MKRALSMQFPISLRKQQQRFSCCMFGFTVGIGRLKAFCKQ